MLSNNTASNVRENLFVPSIKYVWARQGSHVGATAHQAELLQRPSNDDNCVWVKWATGEEERIGNSAFRGCNFTKFRSPSLVSTIPIGMFNGCTTMFSLEVPENTIRLERYVFGCCHSLRNIALASNTVVSYHAFYACLDLLHIFDTLEAIIDALRNRFKMTIIYLDKLTHFSG